MHATANAPSSRVAAIDLIRGAVMILMALDHVRAFAGVPAGGPTPAIFFTRWVTHFCAPAFIFFAGTSAFFYGRRHNDLTRFLFTRGIWLVLLELSYLRLAWTFNFDFAHYQMAGVIWVIGWSMVVLAALVRLPLCVVGGFGLVVVFAHNAVDPHFSSWAASLSEHRLAWLLKLLYFGFWAGPVQLGEGLQLVVLYSLVPWVGVMACGYAFAAVLAHPRRDSLCLWIGLCATVLFLLLRGFNLYGDPRPWSREAGTEMPAILSFFNTTKYPASLLFLLMTLGPTLAAIPALERVQGRVASAIAMFGHVPFFYYMLHIPLIHALALLVSWLRQGAVDPWLFANHPMGNPPPPAGAIWSLPLLYLIWIISLAILYLACSHFARLKARRSDWWLRYL